MGKAFLYITNIIFVDNDNKNFQKKVFKFRHEIVIVSFVAVIRITVVKVSFTITIHLKGGDNNKTNSIHYFQHIEKLSLQVQ